MNEIIGVAFPIQKRYTDRFFVMGKTVFIKPATIFSHLKEGLSFYIYQSREDTGFLGEAKIKKIVFSKDPFTFFQIYGDKIFLTRQELSDYIEMGKKWKLNTKNPKERNWIAVELDNIIKYEKIVKTENFVPVSGRYMTEDEKEEIILGLRT